MDDIYGILKKAKHTGIHGILKKAEQTHLNWQDLSPATNWCAGDCPEKVQCFLKSFSCKSWLRLHSLGCSYYGRSHSQLLELLADFKLKCIQTGCSFPGTAVSHPSLPGKYKCLFIKPGVTQSGINVLP